MRFILTAVIRRPIELITLMTGIMRGLNAGIDRKELVKVANRCLNKQYEFELMLVYRLFIVRQGKIELILPVFADKNH